MDSPTRLAADRARILLGQRHFGLRMLRFAVYPVSVSGTALAAGACCRNRGLAPFRSQESGAVQLKCCGKELRPL